MIEGYDYSSKESREITIQTLFDKAKKQRNPVEADWDAFERLYNFQRDAMSELEGADDWKAPVMPDAWIQVESSVVTEIPEPEFRGRDNDLDSTKARNREYVVRYISENNHLKEMAVEQDKRMIKLGDTFVKAYWDSTMRCGKDEGDIRVIPVSPRNIYPDPSIADGKLENCEYVDYVYSMHKVAFARMYKRELEKAGLELEELVGKTYTEQDGSTEKTDTVEVLEHWFRQPEDGKDTHAGCIGCSILVSGHEIKYIPNYWKNSWRQTQEFPFVQFWRIKNERSFWNFSELYPIADMLYAADRKLAAAAYADAMMSNDVVIVEEEALADGEEITNEPGAVWTVKPGRGGAVRRLGGVQSLANSAVTLEWYKEQMERTTRNYETSRGKEAARTSTATGLAMLRADADSQEKIKQADRNHGYERLYRLLDKLALEFFDDGRQIFLGADPVTGREQISFAFDSREYAMTSPEILDANGETLREEYKYFPEVDVSITATDALITGTSQTIQILDSLIERIKGVDQTNWLIVKEMLNMLQLPNRQDIIKDLEARFSGMQQTPDIGGESMGALPMSGENVLPEDPTARLPTQVGGVPTNI